MTVDSKKANPAGEEGKQFGKYRLDRHLGDGAYGTVWIAFDTQLGRKVALKLIGTVSESQSFNMDQVFNEARAASASNHENVITVYDAGMFEQTGQHYIAMELCDYSLQSLVLDISGGPALKSRDAAELIAQVCRGVAAAHARNVLHRDLKPENILLLKGRPKVSDFGLAKSGLEPTAEAATDSKQSISFLIDGHTICGTAPYMAPEVAREEGATPLSDVYSLGAILYFLLSGQLPFSSNAKSILELLKQISNNIPPPLPPHLPISLRRICERAMSRNPGERHQSAHELAQDLEAWLNHRPTSLDSTYLWRRSWLWYRRNVIVASLGFVLLAIGTISYFQITEQRRELANSLATGRMNLSYEAEQGRDFFKALVLSSKAVEAAPENSYKLGLYKLRTSYLATKAPSYRSHFDYNILNAKLSKRGGLILINANVGYLQQLKDLRIFRTNSGKHLPSPKVGFDSSKIIGVMGAAISPDEKHVAVVLDDKDSSGQYLLVWNIETGDSVFATRTPRLLKAMDISFTPDSRAVLVRFNPTPFGSSRWSGIVYVIKQIDQVDNLSSLSGELLGSDYRVITRVVTEDNSIDVARSGYISQTTEYFQSVNVQKGIPSVSSNPAHNWILSADGSGLRVLDIMTGKTISARAKPVGQTGPIQSAVFDESATLVASLTRLSSPPSSKDRIALGMGMNEYELQTWIAENGVVLGRRRLRWIGDMVIGGVSQDGRNVICILAENENKDGLQVVDMQSDSIRQIPTMGRVYYASFDSSEAYIVVVSGYDGASLWDVHSGKLISSLQWPKDRAFFGTSPSGLLVFTRRLFEANFIIETGGKTVEAWNIYNQGEMKMDLNFPAAETNNKMFRNVWPIHDGRALIVECRKDRPATSSQFYKPTALYLIQIDSNETWRRQLAELSGPIRTMRISEDGKTLAVAHQDSSDQLSEFAGKKTKDELIRILRLNDEKNHLSDPIRIRGTVYSLALSNNTELTVVYRESERDAKLVVSRWAVSPKVKELALVRKFDGLSGALSADAKYLLFLDSSYAIRIASVESDWVSSEFRDPELFVDQYHVFENSFSVQIDGPTNVKWQYPGFSIRLSSLGGKSIFVNTASGIQFTKELRESRTVAFSSNGTLAALVAPGNESDSVRIVENSSGNPVSGYLRHESRILAAQFSDNGRWLFTITEGGILRQWPCQIKDEDKPKWVTTIGEALTGLKMVNEKDVVKLSPDELTNAQGVFGKSLDRAIRTRDEVACFLAGCLGRLY